MVLSVLLGCDSVDRGESTVKMAGVIVIQHFGNLRDGIGVREQKLRCLVGFFLLYDAGIGFSGGLLQNTGALVAAIAKFLRQRLECHGGKIVGNVLEHFYNLRRMITVATAEPEHIVKMVVGQVRN